MTSSQYTQYIGVSKSAPSQLLSFDDVCKYFSMPLADAATHLGVCVSVLKKICRENGLDRWPYRKFLCGKSIEEIRRYAARERIKELEEIKRCAARERIKELGSEPGSRSSGSQPQFKEMSKLQSVVTSPLNLQQHGNKNVPVVQPNIFLSSSLTKGMMGPDEFKYGFPRDGLSSVTNKWWGCSSADGGKGIREDEAETDEEDKHQSKEKADDSAAPIVENENPGNGKSERNVGLQGAALLTAIRKRAAEEGREALKLGVYKKSGIKKLGRKERVLLHRIFGSSSLPKEWQLHESS